MTEGFFYCRWCISPHSSVCVRLVCHPHTGEWKGLSPLLGRKIKPPPRFSFSPLIFPLISTSDKTQSKSEQLSVQGVVCCQAVTPPPPSHLSPCKSPLRVRPCQFSLRSFPRSLCSSSFSLQVLVRCISLILYTGHELARKCYLVYI